MNKFKKSALLNADFCPSTQEDKIMSTVNYKFNDGTKVSVEVSEEIAKVCKDSDREYEREKRKQSRYCVCFDILNDKDKEIGVYDDYQLELDKPEQPDYLAFFQALTERQMQVLKLLYQGKKPLEVAEILNITKQSVNDIRVSIQKKFIKFFGNSALLNGKICPSI